jgi:hypothetical protein
MLGNLEVFLTALLVGRCDAAMSGPILSRALGYAPEPLEAALGEARGLA